MSQFGFSFVTGEGYLRRLILPWLQASGGIMSHEEIELRVATEARNTFSVCAPEAVIEPDHKALDESRTDTYFGGGLHFDLDIASPRVQDVVVFLSDFLGGKGRTMSQITQAFWRGFEMLPAVILIDPNHGVQPDYTRPELVLRKIESLRAVMILSHRISRSISQSFRDPRRPLITRHASLIHAGAHSRQ